jgi:hypothetical protein
MWFTFAPNSAFRSFPHWIVAGPVSRIVEAFPQNLRQDMHKTPVFFSRPRHIDSTLETTLSYYDIIIMIM